MKINVNDQCAVLTEDDTLVQNAEKSYPVTFEFDESWEGFQKTALFEAGSASIVVVLTEDRCTVPAECLKRGGVTLRVGVRGVKGGTRRETLWCLAGKVLYSGGIDTGQSSPSQPMPDDLYAEIMAAIGDLGAAGFEGKTLAEVLAEIKNGACDTATDDEVGSALDGAFGDTATDQEVNGVLNDIFGRPTKSND